MNKSFPKPFYRWRPHPWHGLDLGPEPPRIVHAFIEICPFDLVKYEVDKTTGYLRVDRPHRTSSQHPTLYGFIPKTYCGDKVGALMENAERGDGDPLDICVRHLRTERAPHIENGNTAQCAGRRRIADAGPW
jgi:inorganic pyrophosphatase